MSSATREISQRELADRLGVTTRSVRDFVLKGLPKSGEGPSAKHPWPDSRIWYNAYLERLAETRYRPNDLDALRARKLEADCQLAEIEVAKAEQELIPFEMHEARLGAICDRLRSALTIIPSKFLSRILSAKSDIEAQAVGEQIRDETLRALQGVAEDISDDVETDDATGPQPLTEAVTSPQHSKTNELRHL